MKRTLRYQESMRYILGVVEISDGRLCSRRPAFCCRTQTYIFSNKENCCLSNRVRVEQVVSRKNMRERERERDKENFVLHCRHPILTNPNISSACEPPDYEMSFNPNLDSKPEGSLQAKNSLFLCIILYVLFGSRKSKDNILIYQIRYVYHSTAGFVVQILEARDLPARFYHLKLEEHVIFILYLACKTQKWAFGLQYSLFFESHSLDQLRILGEEVVTKSSILKQNSNSLKRNYGKFLIRQKSLNPVRIKSESDWVTFQKPLREGKRTRARMCALAVEEDSCRDLYIGSSHAKYSEKWVPVVLVDNGSAINVCPARTAYALGLRPKNDTATTQYVRAYDNT
ncbi:hypothetical protein HYC85_029161 [Camellia sinensis]|uniref:Uncharacterized protein n=1 Tax=Camellia sinensis TaxID=4442 RepID=A0A7J7FX71_CAMSI|nr:hypothetical protein HYC85_029161 [Camellia sinensis]